LTYLITIETAPLIHTVWYYLSVFFAQSRAFASWFSRIKSSIFDELVAVGTPVVLVVGADDAKLPVAIDHDGHELFGQVCCVDGCVDGGVFIIVIIQAYL